MFLQDQAWLFPLLSATETEQVLVVMDERPTSTFRKVSSSKLSKGLGQLEAYIGAEEGVAFKMDNGMFWDSLHSSCEWTVEGIDLKRNSSKFEVTLLPAGKVILRNWLGMFLAPVKVETQPVTFPIQPHLLVEDSTLHFDVYFSGDVIAFRAYNGLWLSRICRDFTGLEAATFFADDPCYFQPFVGDLIPPTINILRVIPKGLRKMRYYRYFLMKESHINQSVVPVRHTFTMTWETKSTDQVVWNRLWGLGVPSSCSFRVGDAKATVQYTQNNENTVSMIRQISEVVKEEVEIPPKTKAIAKLYVHKHNAAVVPFNAVVQVLKSNGVKETLHEWGAWKGLAYRDLRIEVTCEGLHES